MCCDYTTYAEKMQKLKLEVLAEVLPSLQGLAILDVRTYLRAAIEILSALELESFNAYRPMDAELWEISAQSIRIRVDFDDERVYMLAALLQCLLPSLAGDLEEIHCRRMLSKKLPVSV